MKASAALVGDQLRELALESRPARGTHRVDGFVLAPLDARLDDFDEVRAAQHAHVVARGAWLNADIVRQLTDG